MKFGAEQSSLLAGSLGLNATLPPKLIKRRRIGDQPLQDVRLSRPQLIDQLIRSPIGVALQACKLLRLLSKNIGRFPQAVELQRWVDAE